MEACLFYEKYDQFEYEEALELPVQLIVDIKDEAPRGLKDTVHFLCAGDEPVIELVRLYLHARSTVIFYLICIGRRCENKVDAVVRHLFHFFQTFAAYKLAHKDRFLISLKFHNTIWCFFIKIGNKYYNLL